MNRRIYVQLGRYGDVFNVLPLLKADYDRTGVRPFLMIAEEFASVMDGVSYARRVIWPGKFEDVGGAMVMAEKFARIHDLSVVCTQIYGHGLASTEDCFSFMRESWARVPDSPAWGSLPLVFDIRDQARETAVREMLLMRTPDAGEMEWSRALRAARDTPGIREVTFCTGHISSGKTRSDVAYGSRSVKPYVILALSGTSSPFEHGQELAKQLRSAFRDRFDFIDISGFAAPRIYDLLGVLEGAHCIVTIDSSILHLAHAVPKVPVVAFITREPSKWHGSPWRSQQVARFYYDEAPDCFAGVKVAVEQARQERRIYHAYTHIARGASDDAARRNDFAASTWVPEYATGAWVPRPFGDGELQRSSGDAPINDERPIPFMHDVIGHALPDNGSWNEGDIIAWTNADSCFVPGITGLILDAVSRYGAAYTHRFDFHRPLSVALPHEAAIRRGEWYPGTDACFFTVEWWLKHRHEYPDMLVGREQNDEVLRQLIKARGGVEIPAAIYHEKHASFWEHHGRKMTGLGNQWNHRLAKKWFTKMGYRPLDPIWWQLEPEPKQTAWARAHIAQYGTRGILTR